MWMEQANYVFVVKLGRNVSSSLITKQSANKIIIMNLREIYHETAL